jgi:pimeloyl-ACP methyl ester carboxylesterase
VKPDYRTIETARVRHRVLDVGSGPPVVLLHGFPEGAFSWRHQLRALADAGFRAIAPDQRGYAGTEPIVKIDGYDQVELALDVVALLDALGLERATLIGHDWGASLTWHTALLHPDRIASVVAMSVPYGGRSRTPPIALIEKSVGDAFFYMLYFQEPGVAEAELEVDVRESLRRFYYSASGGIRAASFMGPYPKNSKLLDTLKAPAGLPPWLDEEELQHFTDSFTASGFAGPIGWYRSMDRSWERTPELADAKVTQPTLFIAGTHDPVILFGARQLERMPKVVTNLSRVHLIEGAGHWIQQERPAEVNSEIIRFLTTG